jgi:hypothetical protein
MNRNILLLCFSLCCLRTSAQEFTSDLVNGRRTSYYTYVFRLDDREARTLYRKDIYAVTDTYFHTVVDSFPTRKVYDERRLLRGHYLFTYAKGGRLAYDLMSVCPLSVKVLNNQVDLSVWVADSLGNTIPDAIVRLKSKSIPFDPLTRTYRLRKTNRKGILSIKHGNFTSYHQLDAQYRSSWMKRTAANVMRYSGIGYLLKPFRDTYSSIRYGQPVGWLRVFSDGIGHSYYWNTRTKGYMVFNKPMYLPGDTVKFKAFVVTKRGKPVDKPLMVNLNVEGKPKMLTRLTPYRKGGYAFEFPLADSLGLKLDRPYTITLNDEKQRTYVAESFRVEDYELKSNTFRLRSEKESHHPGTSISLYAKGTDENDLNLMDARLQLTVWPLRVRDLHPTVFVPDTLWRWEQNLDAVGETKITLPDSIFPPVSLDYQVEAVFLNASNERHRETLQLTYSHDAAKVLLQLEQDTLVADIRVAGRQEEAQAVLIAYADEEEDKVLSEKTIRFPHKEKINPLVSHYEIETTDQVETLGLRNQAPLINCLAYRTADSIFVQIENPRQIPFWYHIYRQSKEVKRGAGTELIYQAKVKTDDNYSISLQYVWGGQSAQQNYRIPFSKKELRIEIDQPAVIYPGQKARINLSVTDAEGQPARQVDLTAYAFTQKFKNAYLPSLPSFEKKSRNRRSVNSFTLKEMDEKHSAHQLDWQRWRTEMGLDSLAYYHFLYPSTGVFMQYLPIKDSVSQISPFVVKRGAIQPACLIYLDNKPVYYKDTDVMQRYSFQLDSGHHSVKIRTHYKLIEFPQLRIRPRQKLVLSLDLDRLPPGVKVSDVPNKFTDEEQRLLDRYLMWVRPFPNKEFAYLKQNNFIQLMQSRSDHWYRQPMKVGLFVNRPMQLVREEYPTTSFGFEPGFEYEFEEGLIKMRSIRQQKVVSSPIPRDFRYWEPDFREKVATQAEMDSMWRWRKEERQAEQKIYDNPSQTQAGFGRLMISRPIPTDKRIKHILIFRRDNPDFLRVYNGSTSLFHQLQPGRYKVVLLLYFNEYIVQDSIDILPNGTNYVRIRESVVHPVDPFSRKASERIGESGFIFKKDLQEIKEQYNQTYNVQPMEDVPAHFTHWVEGQVLAGDDGTPLPGVNVVVKGTKVGTSTDAQGYYRLYAPFNGVLIFSFIGCVSEELLIGSRSILNAKLQADIKALSEVVVVGYGTQSRRAVTGSIAVVSNALQGRVEGVMIRGNSALKSSEPLLVVDGVPFNGTLADLDQAAIASTEILKPEAALVLYGVRASNGVLLITTRKAKEAANQAAPGVLEAMAHGTGLRNLFSDYAYWQPQLTTDESGKASFEVTFPDDITRWRTFVLAMDDQKRSGSAESSVKSFRTLAASLSLPRFLVQGDTTQAIGKIQNYTSDTLSVERAFKINGKASAILSGQVIHALVDTTLLYAARADTIEVKYAVTKSDGYLDGEMRRVPVYPPGTMETRGIFLNLDRDTTLTLPFDPAMGKVKLYAQGDVLYVLLDEMDHVRNYEYLCNEQMASKLKALLLGKKVRTYLKQPFPYEKDIRQLVRKLDDARGKEKAWGWWPGSPFSHWITLHVAEALLEAGKAGYSSRFQARELTDYLVYEMEGRQRAEKIPLLQLLQTLGARVDYQRYTEELSRDTTLSLHNQLRLIRIRQQAGLTYRLDTLREYQQETVLGGLFWGKEKYDLTDNAIINTVLAYRILRDQAGQEASLLRIRNYFLEKRRSGYWRNTYESTLILETILPDLLKADSTLQSTRLTLSGAVSDTVLTVFPYETMVNANKSLTIQKQGQRPLYLTAYQQFQNAAPQKVEKDFVVKTAFEGKKGDKVILEAGKPVLLKIEVEASKEADYVLVEVPIPAGCSYEDKRTFYGKEAYREYFRNKVSIFCPQLSVGKHEFTVRLLPRYTGTYALNPTKVELMYFPVFYGRAEMKRIRIR